MNESRILPICKRPRRGDPRASSAEEDLRLDKVSRLWGALQRLMVALIDAARGPKETERVLSIELGEDLARERRAVNSPASLDRCWVVDLLICALQKSSMISVKKKELWDRRLCFTHRAEHQPPSAHPEVGPKENSVSEAGEDLADRMIIKLYWLFQEQEQVKP